MTPFRDITRFRLPAREETPEWQILPKPCGSLKLFSALSQLFADDPQCSSPARIHRSVPHSALSYFEAAMVYSPRSHAMLGPTPFRVLICDDQGVNQKLLAFLVETSLAADRPKPICDLAHNGLHAIECVQYSEYDLVLMDINMPYSTPRLDMRGRHSTPLRLN